MPVLHYTYQETFPGNTGWRVIFFTWGKERTVSIGLCLRPLAPGLVQLNSGLSKPPWLRTLGWYLPVEQTSTPSLVPDGNP
jgi:hypothetical protein